MFLKHWYSDHDQTYLLMVNRLFELLVPLTLEYRAL